MNNQAFIETKSKRNRISSQKPIISLKDVRDCIVSLPDRERKVYFSVIKWIEYGNREGWEECFPSQTTIGEYTGYCRQSVNEAIGNLVGVGLIEKINYYRKTCSYFMPTRHQTKRFRMMLKDIYKPALLSILSLIPWSMSMPLEGSNDSKRDKNIGIYKTSVSQDAKKKTSRVCFDDHCLSYLVDESDFYHPQLKITQAGKIFCTAFSREVVREAFSRMHHVKNIRNLNRCFAWLCMEIAMEMHVIPTFSLMFALRMCHGYQANNSVPFFVVKMKQTLPSKPIQVVTSTPRKVIVSDLVPHRPAPQVSLEESLQTCKVHGFMGALLAARKNVLGY